MPHIPVLQREIIECLKPGKDENFIDCTMGDGGHAQLILEKNAPKGKVLGIDWDEENIIRLKERFKKEISEKRVILVNDNFANLKEIKERENFQEVSGIMLDLGMSSRHLESKRGFTFLRNEPLDMRFNSSIPITAAKILNFWSMVEIERILREYGEEKFSKKIAQEIVSQRNKKQIETTQDLIKILSRAIPKSIQRQKIHFATRTFQALRIAVNDELNNLQRALGQAFEILRPGGRLAVISFHSLEDGIVKNFFRDKVRENSLELITKKPIRPNQDEIKINPRSRSSRLRAAVRSISQTK
ncbi:MAG: 16S rRNA (cytosine(1402)-N(4))-methyltransferase RsmH [Candidatus Pacebacteria bacterium]|nr:16S rRNA (cytosine(1402)-N(4))-methyltransferase RsmH [Candidatus Paceibacterota bacterium]